MDAAQKAGLSAGLAVAVAVILVASGKMEISFGTESGVSGKAHSTDRQERKAIASIAFGNREDPEVRQKREAEWQALLERELKQRDAQWQARLNEHNQLTDGHIAELSRQLTSQQRENADLDQKLADVQQEMRRLTAIDQERQLAVVQLLQEQVKSLQTERVDMQARLAETQTRLLTAITELRDAKNAVHQVQQELLAERNPGVGEPGITGVFASPSTSSGWKPIPGRSSTATPEQSGAKDLSSDGTVRRPSRELLPGERSDMIRELRRGEMSRELQHQMELYRRVMERHRRERAEQGFTSRY